MKFSVADILKVQKVEMATPLDLTRGRFYVKKAYDSENKLLNYSLAVKELITYYMARKISLISPSINIILPNESDYEEAYIVSEDLNNYGKFQTMEQLGLAREESSSLYEIWFFLEKKFASIKNKEEILELFRDIIKMYLLDIFLGNWDRLHRNWGIIFTPEKMFVAIIDNENILTDFVPNISIEFAGTKYFDTRKKLAARENNLNYYNLRRDIIKDNLKTFLKTSSYEAYQIFKEMYDVLTPEYFINLLDYIEKEEKLYTLNGIKDVKIIDKDELINCYRQNYALITDIGKELSNGRK